ncbi:MAG: hypothetical protein ABF697_08930 [Zymomonas mobilis]|uniref:hypothetical protein n=1 Tax=Zymomonas mobilis TaxID=542 RepID=UPI0039EC31C3
MTHSTTDIDKSLDLVDRKNLDDCYITNFTNKILQMTPLLKEFLNLKAKRDEIDLKIVSVLSNFEQESGVLLKDIGLS